MTFLLKKPVYYIEILFSHYVKVLFQIEIPFPHYVKAQFHIEILFPHYVNVQFQIEIPFPHYVNVQFQIEIPFPHYVNVQFQIEIPFLHYVKVQFQNEIPLLHGLNVIFQKIFIFIWRGKAFERSPGRFSAAKKCITWVAIRKSVRRNGKIQQGGVCRPDECRYCRPGNGKGPPPERGQPFAVMVCGWEISLPTGCS